MKNRLTRGAMLLVLAGALTIPASHSAHAANKIVLNYWRHDYPPALKIDRMLAAQFMKLHPNIQINLVNQGTDSQVYQKTTIAFAGGGAPDIVNVYNGFFQQWSALGFFQPIQPAAFGVKSNTSIASSWLKGTLNGWLLKGQYYGIPSEVSTYFTVISPPLFRAAGLDPVKDAPKTWEDILRVGKKLAKVQNGALVKQGYGIASDPGVLAIVFDSMVHQLGGYVVSPDGSKAAINSPAGVKALTMLLSYKQGKVSQLASKPLQGPGFDTASSAIITDVGLWYRGYLQGSAPKVYANGSGMKILPFPYFAGGKAQSATLYGYAWCVNAHSPNAAAAWQFVKYLSDNTTPGYLDAGIMQPKTTLRSLPNFAKNPDNTLGFSALGTGAPYAGIPDQIGTIIGGAVSSALLDNVAPQAALDKANQLLTRLLPTLPYKISM
ncbi:MAG: transporter substrate-binding protein [Chloroflexi bacterium]|nr:transporter substrate-binding protein [Chloroflexota bacterium]